MKETKSTNGKIRRDSTPAWKQEQKRRNNEKSVYLNTKSDAWDSVSRSR